jgi:hypothetical protein
VGHLLDICSTWRPGRCDPAPESDTWGYFEGPTLCFERGRLPRDGGPDLRTRGAWRRGTPALPTPHEVDLYELDHPLPSTPAERWPF